MRILRCIAAALIAAVMLASCGSDKPEIKSMEYETPVATFVNAFNKGDEDSLVKCFTAGAQEEFSKSGEKAVEALKESIENAAGNTTVLSYTLDEKTQLGEEYISSLKESYTEKYGKRLDIKKAYSLKVTFKAVPGNKEYVREMITIKTDSGWCIYGDVITKIELKDKTDSEA